MVSVKSIEAEEGAQTAVDSREAHESQREQTGREHDDGHAAHALGNVDQLELFAHAGKDGQGQSEANGCGEGIDDGLQQVEVLLDDQNGYTQHGAVGGDERQEDAQGLIERRRDLLEDDFDHLHQGGNDQDEGDGLQILQSEGVEHIGLNEPRNDGGQRHDEGNGCRHAQRGVDLLGHAEERTDAEELRQDDIVDEYRANENQDIFHSCRYFVITLFRYYDILVAAQLVDDGDEESQHDERARRQHKEQDVVGLGQQGQTEY